MLSSAELLFIIFYWLLFTALILKISIFKKFGIPEWWIAAIFFLKVILGVAYGVIHFQVYKGGDTFGYFSDSKIVMSSLPHQPLHYLQLVFGITQRPPHAAVAVYAYKMSYSTDMSSYFMVRAHALMNLFTLCHYYGNVVIYNFLTLIGQLLLFKFFINHQPEKKIALLLLLFLFPSVSFWCSGFHKDGIALAAIGLILFFGASLFKAFQKSKWNEPDTAPEINYSTLNNDYFTTGKLFGLILLLTGVWLLIAVRNYLLLLMIPCLIAFCFSIFSPRKSFVKYLVVFTLFYAVIFQLKLLNPQWDILNEMAGKQQEFLAGGDGETNIDLPVLLPEMISLLEIAPTALFHCLFLPSVFDLSSPLQLSSVIDNLAMLLLFIVVLLTTKRNLRNVIPLFLLCVFFAVSVFIFTGAIVPNIGALVRYKMPGTLFLAIGLLSIMDAAKIKRLLHLK